MAKYLFGIRIPREGREPGERPWEAEPHAIEFSGVHWAVATCGGWCSVISKDDDEFKTCMHNMLPKFLESREKWESGTWHGMRKSAGLD